MLYISILLYNKAIEIEPLSSTHLSAWHKPYRIP